MTNQQFISRSFELDIGHRVLHERMKCFSIHGHRVKIELTFSFEQKQAIGYCIDFKEIKRMGGQWLDDMMDHGFIANPHDEVMINAAQQTGSKLYLMSLAGKEHYCNPTAENIANEIFLAMEILFDPFEDLSIHQVRYYETPNCWVDVTLDSIDLVDRHHFYASRLEELLAYRNAKGILEYDSRKSTAP